MTSVYHFYVFDICQKVISWYKIKDKSKANLEILALWSFFLPLYNLSFVKLVDDLQGSIFNVIFLELLYFNFKS